MIIVFGSINMDMHMGIRAFPQKGETVISSTYDTSPGGKGANQALAAARSGEKTALVGVIGNDGMGTRIVNNLRRFEVMTSGVATADNYPTGMAMIMREPDGDNRIIMLSGANMEVSATQVPDEILGKGNVLLVQMELHLRETLNVMERAKKNGAKVIVNLAPASESTTRCLEHADIVIMNALESDQLMKNLNVHDPARRLNVLSALCSEFDCHLIVTMGGKGAVMMAPSGKAWQIGALALESIVDTTGAGDCFCGTFAAGIHAGMTLPNALKRASVAGGLACLKKGAQESYPYSGDIDERLGKLADAQEIEI